MLNLPDVLPPELLAEKFPELNSSGYSITSPINPYYNCIAWAVGEVKNWWWPNLGFWPEDVPEEETLSAFISAYETKNFTVCENGNLEDGFVKVALYTEDGTKSGRPLHAARQRYDGTWSSKLGQGFDITHDSVHGVSGGAYGRVAVYMKRPS